MSYLATARAAQDPTFKLRIAACLYKLAGDVVNEADDAPNHAERVKLARRLRSTFAFPTEHFAWLCASNPAIAASVSVDADGAVTVGAPDGDIEFVCASGWDDVASRYAV